MPSGSIYVVLKQYLHVDKGGNCTPLSLHSRTMRAFTFRQMSNTLEERKWQIEEVMSEQKRNKMRLCNVTTCS